MATSAGLSAARSLRFEIGLLSDRDLAEMLELNTETLQTWRSEGKGPSFTRLGKKVFYRLADVTSWIEANIVRPIAGTTTAGHEATV
jgi:hypothetical protein